MSNTAPNLRLREYFGVVKEFSRGPERMAAQRVIDQEARDLAQSALSRMNTHEQVCAQRWGNVSKTLSRVEKILWLATITLISTLAAIINWLMTHPLMH